MPSTGDTNQTSESETTEKSCKNLGPTKPSKQLKCISRSIVKAIPKNKAALVDNEHSQVQNTSSFSNKRKIKSKKMRRNNKRGKKKEKGSIKLEKIKQMEKNISNVTKNIEVQYTRIYDHNECQRNGKCSCGTWVHEGCVLIQLDKNVTFCPICLKIKHITSCINISIASYTY